MDTGPLWLRLRALTKGVVMSLQQLILTAVTPTRTPVSNQLRTTPGPLGIGPVCTEQTVSEYGPGALVEDLAEAIGLNTEAFARELATRQTIDTIGARYGKSPIQLRCAVMDRLRVRLQRDAGKSVPFQHARIDGILDHASKFIDTLMRQSGAFLAPTFSALSTVDALKAQSDQRRI